MNIAAAQASAGGSFAALVLILLVSGIGIACYLAPGIVASVRHVPNAGSVWIINVLLGWTLVGWAIALAMACRSRYQAVMTPYGPQRMFPPPPVPPGFRPPSPQPYGYDPGQTPRYRQDVESEREDLG